MPPRSTPTRDHDRVYRDLFTHPELVEDLLRHYVGGAWIAEIEFSSLKRENEISIVRRRGARIRDVVWSVRFRDRPLYILILIEFQSRVDPVMALRQLIYVASLYEDLHRQKRLAEGGKLPPVLPIVLYNGERPWRAPCSVEEMIEEVPEPLARFQPRMSYFLLDERRTSYELGDARDMVGALLALEQSQVGEDVFEAVLYLVNLLREPQHESLRQAFKGLMLGVLSPQLSPIAEVFDHPEDPMTTRERLEHWYQEQRDALLAEGRQEGRQEGVKQGRTEGQRGILAKQLKLKFGPLDAEAEARLAQATSAQLGRWAERVLTASSLAEIWC